MNEKLKILIVEDEAIIADHISDCVEQMGHSVISIIDDGNDLISEIGNLSPDIALLDIKISGTIDGVDVAHHLNRLGIPFVFISSNADDKTLSRVKLTNPLGFIFKPFSKEQLKLSIELAISNYNNLKKHTEIVNDSEIKEDNIYIKDKQKYVKVETSSILYCEALDNYSAVYTDKQRFVLSFSLKTLGEKLSTNLFERIHRSYLVNTKKIDSIGPKSVIIGKKEIPITEAARQELLGKLKTI